MSDEKITQLTADTAPTTDDLAVIVNDPAGTPGTKKVTLSNLFTVIWAAVTNAATAKTTPADGDLFSIVDSAASNVIKSLSWLNLRQNLNADGWIPVTDTWTYASASTITIPTDGTTVYQKGIKIRLKQGGGYKYYVGKTVAATLLTVITNTDYTVANAAITDVSYSYAENPYGFPSKFAYTSTVNGVGGSIGTYAETSIISHYATFGSTVRATVHKKITNKGSWSGGFRVALPTAIYAFGGGRPIYLNTATVIASSSIAPKGFGGIYSASAILEFESSLGAVLLDWSAIAVNDWIIIDIMYEM